VDSCGGPIQILRETTIIMTFTLKENDGQAMYLVSDVKKLMN